MIRQTVRENVFETNSSSVHALVVPKEYDASEVEYKGRNLDLPIGDDEFGWGYDVLVSEYDILSYLWTGTHSDRLKELFPNVEFSQNDWGYIDHQSHDLPFDILELSDDEIYNAVIHGKLIISNDNRDEPRIEYDEKTEKIYQS